MQALLFTAIREQRLVELPIPQIDRPDGVLLKVKSVGVCGSDLHGYTGQSGRRVPPLIMGHEVTAEVIESTATQPSPIAPPWLRAMQARLNSRAMLDAMHVY